MNAWKIFPALMLCLVLGCESESSDSSGGNTPASQPSSTPDPAKDPTPETPKKGEGSTPETPVAEKDNPDLDRASKVMEQKMAAAQLQVQDWLKEQGIEGDGNNVDLSSVGGNVDLAPIAGNTSVEALNLDGCNVDSGTFRLAAAFPNLKELTVRNCERMDPNGLSYLLKARSLEKLDLRGSQVDPQMVSKLKTVLKDCQILGP